MKTIIFLFALTLMIKANNDQDRWLNFKLAFGKTYKNIQDEQERFEIFRENLRNIEDNNRRFEFGEVKYKLGVNKFADISQDEFAASLSTRQIDEQFTETRYEYEDQRNEYFDGNDSLPTSVDWRTSGAISDVLDERMYYTGYSWAFSAAGAIESHLFIYTKTTVSLSAQRLIDCCEIPENTIVLPLVFDYVLANGISTEEKYPYSGGKGTCNRWADVIELDYFNMLWNEYQIKSAVANGGPVSVSIDGSQLANYESGIIESQLCNNSNLTLNHAAIVVGYGTDNELDYWILKNSWGTDWGEKGYFRLQRGNGTCGIGGSSILPGIYNTTDIN